VKGANAILAAKCCIKYMRRVDSLTGKFDWPPQH